MFFWNNSETTHTFFFYFTWNMLPNWCCLEFPSFEDRFYLYFRTSMSIFKEDLGRFSRLLLSLENFKKPVSFFVSLRNKKQQQVFSSHCTKMPTQIQFIYLIKQKNRRKSTTVLWKWDQLVDSLITCIYLIFIHNAAIDNVRKIDITSIP